MSVRTGTLRWHRRSLGFFTIDGRPRRMPARAFVLSAIAAPERLIADLAALAIEHRAEIHSTDADFERFPGLRHVNPLA